MSNVEPMLRSATQAEFVAARRLVRVQLNHENMDKHKRTAGASACATDGIRKLAKASAAPSPSGRSREKYPHSHTHSHPPELESTVSDAYFEDMVSIARMLNAA